MPDRRAPRRKRLLLVALLPAVLLLSALGAGTALQLNRALPAATLTTDVPATLRIPGKAPTLPWPRQGAAELMIEGLGRLGGKGSDKPAPIGSVAKVMTAYVILQSHPLEGDEEGPTLTVTAADVADFRARIASNQSLVPVVVGQTMTQRDALEALMLPSANNIAHQLAVWDGGDEASFVAKMNAAADELGMADTEYSDPSGYLPTTVSTAADQVKLGRAAIRSEVFAEIVARTEATIPRNGTIRNYNDLLGEQGVFGIKTGSTTEAGGNLLFAAKLSAGGRTYTVVGAVFNQPGAGTPQQLARVNTVVRKLLTAVRGTVKEYELLGAQPVGTVTTAWGSTASVTPSTPLRVVGWPGLAVPVQVTAPAPGAGVRSGDVVGAVRASGVRVDLAADRATAEPGLWWRLTRLG
jgi:D-alanyl-D-alanine carboxypeptidase (penicillin-binding protein 5/6)